jgi:hypothetical protein
MKQMLFVFCFGASLYLLAQDGFQRPRIASITTRAFPGDNLIVDGTCNSVPSDKRPQDGSVEMQDADGTWRELTDSEMGKYVRAQLRQGYLMTIYPYRSKYDGSEGIFTHEECVNASMKERINSSR